MNSKELNKKINAICESDNMPFVAYGGKPIPYIGWFWREVDFDSDDGYMFGVLPDGKIGFMENNKWNYDYICCPKEDWKEIKVLVEKVAMKPIFGNLKALNDKIQSLKG